MIKNILVMKNLTDLTDVETVVDPRLIVTL